MVYPIFLLVALTIGRKNLSFTFDTLPDSKTLFITVLFSLLCEDFVQYFAHRLLHHPVLYADIHKRHHEFTTTVSLASEYSHPVEYLLGAILPTAMSSLLL